MAWIIRFLWVKAGSMVLPGKTVQLWGFSTFDGIPQVPGPTIQAQVGDVIDINLFNSVLNTEPIGEPVSIIFPGQKNVMVRQGPRGNFRPVQPQYQDGKLISLADYVPPGPGMHVLTYRFRADKPGIYLYESGTNSEKQIQMGMYGVILVRPAGYNRPFHPNFRTAYGAGTGSKYDVEKVLVLGEFDSVMHESVVPGEYYNVLTFRPDYWAINGRCYPDTLKDNDNSGQPYGSLISCRVGERVLLRIINAGFQSHTLYFGGLTGRVVAEDSFPLATYERDMSYEKAGITLGSGQSADVIITPTAAGEIYLYDREYNHLVNNDQFPGGMMTKMEILP